MGFFLSHRDSVMVNVKQKVTAKGTGRRGKHTMSPALIAGPPVEEGA